MFGFSMLNTPCLILSRTNLVLLLNQSSINFGLHFHLFANFSGLLVVGIKWKKRHGDTCSPTFLASPTDDFFCNNCECSLLTETTEADVMRFPVSVLTTAAVSRSLVLVLTERYYYESDWNSFSNYTHLIGQGRDGFEVARRFRDAAVEDTEGVILDIQAVVGVSQVSFFFGRSRCVSLCESSHHFFQMEADECLRWSSDSGRECRWFLCARFLASFLFLLLTMHHVSSWLSFFSELEYQCQRWHIPCIIGWPKLLFGLAYFFYSAFWYCDSFRLCVHRSVK